MKLGRINKSSLKFNPQLLNWDWIQGYCNIKIKVWENQIKQSWMTGCLNKLVEEDWLRKKERKKNNDDDKWMRIADWMQVQG